NPRPADHLPIRLLLHDAQAQRPEILVLRLFHPAIEVGEVNDPRHVGLGELHSPGRREQRHGVVVTCTDASATAFYGFGLICEPTSWFAWTTGQSIGSTTGEGSCGIGFATPSAERQPVLRNLVVA